MQRYKFTAKQIAEINSACETIKEQEVRRYLEMLRLYAHGIPNKDAMEQTGFSRATIQRYVYKYRVNGLKSLISEIKTLGCRAPTSSNKRCCKRFLQEQIGELKNASVMVKDRRTARRLKAILLRAEGYTLKEVAKITGYNPNFISVITRSYQKNGITAVMGKSRPKKYFVAYKHKFTTEQKAEIMAARKTVIDKKVATRLEVLWLRAEHKSLPEIAELTGFHVMYITKLIKKYQEDGLTTFLKNGYKIMTKREETIILDDFCLRMDKSHPIKSYEVRAAFETKLGRPISVSWIYNMLNRHHWRYDHGMRRWVPPQDE